MQTWRDWERQQELTLQKLKQAELETIRCKSCDSSWFEEIKGTQFRLDHNLVLGQEVPKVNDNNFYVLLRCLRCEDLLQPRVMYEARDVASNAYDNFLDTMEGKEDKRSEGKDKQVEEDPNTQVIADLNARIARLEAALVKTVEDKKPARKKGAKSGVQSKGQQPVSNAGESTSAASSDNN